MITHQRSVQESPHKQHGREAHQCVLQIPSPAPIETEHSRSKARELVARAQITMPQAGDALGISHQVPVYVYFL